jgi:hypothetical protein
MTTAIDHAVLVFLKLSDEGFGELDEREQIFDVEEKLEAAVSRNRIGEYDGHEFGQGWGKLYLYGPDARTLADAVLPILKDAKPRTGSYVVLRFGGPGASEERVPL